MIEKIRKQSNTWLLLGITVVFILVVLAYEWNNLDSNILLILGVVGITGAVIWWFWTMFIMLKLIKQRSDEELALKEIIERIKELQFELKKSLPKKRKK